MSKAPVNKSALDALLQQCASLQADASISADAALIVSSQWSQACERTGYAAILIDRAPVFNKDMLMHAIYQSCEFPVYFGFNWDALVDCWRDFSWRPAKGYFLVLRNPTPLHERAPEALDTLQDVTREVSAFWAAKKSPVPFKLLIGK